MPIVNFSNAVTVVLAIILLLLVLYIGKNTQRSWLLAGAVMVFLALFVGHVCEISLMKDMSTEIRNALNTSVIIDFVYYAKKASMTLFFIALNTLKYQQ